MKRRITLSIALALSIVLVSLMSSDSTANAQQERRLSFDTGILTLGPGQILRISVNAGAGNDTMNVRFTKIEYIRRCTYPICGLFRTSQTTSETTTLTAGEGVSIDINQVEFNAVRGIVAGNFIGTDVKAPRATVQIIDEATGEVKSVLIALLIP